MTTKTFGERLEETIEKLLDTIDHLNSHTPKHPNPSSNAQAIESLSRATAQLIQSVSSTSGDVYSAQWQKRPLPSKKTPEAS